MKKHTPEELEEIFLDLISPQVFRDKFKNDIEFKYYLDNRNLEELNTLMSKFVIIQDYENCCIIRDMINKKKLKKLMK
jgi:protein-arginine kinase activator protein McsA